MFTNTEDVFFNETNIGRFLYNFSRQWGFVDAAIIERDIKETIEKAAKEIDVEASLKLNKEGEFVETKELKDYLHKFKVNK